MPLWRGSICPGSGSGGRWPAATGRPPYDPRDLLKLYLYGYLNEVRSSRRLERECSRNVEVMWLLRRLAPDFKTIADFRRDNGAAIVGACRAFVLFCRDQGLFTARLVALDGSKFRAAASAKRIIGRREIAEEAAGLDHRIAGYLAALDESDAGEPDEAPGATAAALEALRTRRAELDRLAARLDAEERNTLVEGELDARPMGIGNGPKPPSYNVQTAVDADTGLIVHHEVTTEPTDNRLLYPMAKATKDVLEIDRLTVVADAGYSNGTDAAACENDGITPCVPANRAINTRAMARCSIDRLSSTSRTPILILTAARRDARWRASRSCDGTIACSMPPRTAQAASSSHAARPRRGAF